MKKILTSFVLILTAIALTGCGSTSKTMARNLDNTITNLVYSVSNLDVLDNTTISQIKSLNSNQQTAQAALCFLTNNNANNSIFASTTCPECFQSDECNEGNCNNIDVTDAHDSTTVINENKIVKNAISWSNVKNINKFSQNDDKNAEFTGEHPYATTHPGARKIDSNNAYKNNENFCQNNQTNCDNCIDGQSGCCNNNANISSLNNQNRCDDCNQNMCHDCNGCNQNTYGNCNKCNKGDCENCKPICNKPINIDPGFSVDGANSTTNSSVNNNNTDTRNIQDNTSANNNNNNNNTGNGTNNNTSSGNSGATEPDSNQNVYGTKNNSIGINSENITDGDANKILNQTGITTGGNEIDTSTSTNSIYSDLTTSSARISELIADLVKVRTVIMLYISDLYNGSITLSQDEINAINSYANIIKESTAYLKSNQGTVKNHLNEATNFGNTDAYASLANSHIIRATEVLNTRGAKIESAVVATMNIIDILKTNVENAKSQITTGNSNGANSASNTAGGTNGQNANTSQILEGNVANASFEGSGLFGGGSPNYTMNNPYNLGVNGQNYGAGTLGIGTGIGAGTSIGGYTYGAGVGNGLGTYPYAGLGTGVGAVGFGSAGVTGVGATYPMGGLNYGMGGVGAIGAYPYGAGVGVGTGMMNGITYPYGMVGNGVGIGGVGAYPYGMSIGAGVGTGIGAYPYGAGVGVGTGIANGMGGFGNPIAGEIVEGNGVIGGAGLAGNGIVGNGAGVAGGVGVGTGVVNSGVGNTNINGGAMPNVLTGLVSSNDQQPLTDAQTDANNGNNSISSNNSNFIDNSTNNYNSDFVKEIAPSSTDGQPLANTQQCDGHQFNQVDEDVACTAQPYRIFANKKNVRTYTPNPLFGANVNKKSFYDLATQDFINTSTTTRSPLSATEANVEISAIDDQYPAAKLSNADNQYPAAKLSNADNQYPAAKLSNADNQYPAVQLPNGDERYPITTLPDTSQRRPVVTL